MASSVTTGIASRVARVRADIPLVALDALFVAGSYYAVLALRFDGNVPAVFADGFLTFLPLALVAHLGANWAWGLYGHVWRHAGIVEARRVVLAGPSAVAALLLVFWAPGPVAALDGMPPPRSVVVLGGFVVTALVGAVRFQSRLFALTRTTEEAGLRVVLVGAGATAASIAREMLRDPGAGFRPVAMVDDDARLHGLHVAGVSVVGPVDDLPAAVARCRAHQVLLAVPHPDSAFARRVAELAEAAGAPLKVLPDVRDLVSGQPSVRDVRDLHIDDLLGRDQVVTDFAAVRGAIAGRCVLVTGAGGSIGSEIVRQVADFTPDRLVLLDHDETHLFDARPTNGVDHELVLADIRDPAEVDDVFARFRPDVVFHAAAHKHVPMLEAHPSAAVATNVAGTRNVVRAAARHGVDRLVFISTDKAVRPVNVMGASKWVGEQLVLSSAPAGSHWCAVRFGNVLGSRGSVIPVFARQIAAGGPVTVTDPRMTRFFMSVREAVQLVLQAALFADRGEVFMLEMGRPVNILDLAKRMIRLSGRDVGTDIAIRVVGTRPGEKLEEELHAPGEDTRPTPHPSIVALSPVRLAAADLDTAVDDLTALASQRRDDDVRTSLLRLPSSAVATAVIDVRDNALASRP